MIAGKDLSELEMIFKQSLLGNIVTYNEQNIFERRKEK